MRAKRILTAASGCLLLLSCNSLTAFAEVALPEGAVKGLPERLAALDSDGNAVNSATGEYFFHVENMAYGETYTKDVQLMNLREDASYYIYFYVEPLFKDGEIDLEKGCTCRFFLDGTQFYEGDVNGKGNIDLSDMYYCTGFYEPGDSHVLRAEVIWDDLDVIQNVDNGHKLVAKDGTYVLEGPDSSGYAEGEIEFKWIFFASILPAETDIQPTSEPFDDETNVTETTTVPATEVHDATETVSTMPKIDHSDVPMQTTTPRQTTTTTTTTTPPGESPLTGYFPKDGKIWLAAMGVITVMIAALLVLLRRDGNKRDKK